MSTLNIGDNAPDFTLPNDGNGEITLSKHQGQYVVVYFYPKDSTPGCTTESCEFRDAMTEFSDLNAQVIGISKCSVEKHDKFKAKHGFNFPLASDEHSDTCERYGVWKEKNMYGKKFMGIERTTVLIDPNGKIAALWPKVKVKGHVEEVQKKLQEISGK